MSRLTDLAARYKWQLVAAVFIVVTIALLASDRVALVLLIAVAVLLIVVAALVIVLASRRRRSDESVHPVPDNRRTRLVEELGDGWVRVRSAPWRDPQRIVAIVATKACSTTAQLPAGTVAFSDLVVFLDPTTITKLDDWMPIEDVAFDWVQAYARAHVKTPRRSERVKLVVLADSSVPLARFRIAGAFRPPSGQQAVASAWATLSGPLLTGLDRPGASERVPSPDQALPLDPHDSGTALDPDRTRLLSPRVPQAAHYGDDATQVHSRPGSHVDPGSGTAAEIAAEGPALGFRRVEPVSKEAMGSPVTLIDGEVCSLGRSDSSTIQLTQDFVSRDHAQIQREGSTLFITDVRSSRGTFVNGDRLTAGVRRELASGDLIRLGDRDQDAPTFVVR